MDLLYVYAVAGAAVTGALFGFAVAGIVRSGGDAEASAEIDRLREARGRSEAVARSERAAKELKQAKCDELERRLRTAELEAEAAQQSIRDARLEAKQATLALHAATEAAYAAQKEADAERRRVTLLQKQIETMRRRHKDVKKTMRRKRKVRDVIARGAKRLNRRAFPNPGSGSKRSKFQRHAFTMDGQDRQPVVDHSQSSHTAG